MAESGQRQKNDSALWVTLVGTKIRRFEEYGRGRCTGRGSTLTSPANFRSAGGGLGKLFETIVPLVLPRCDMTTSSKTGLGTNPGLPSSGRSCCRSEGNRRPRDQFDGACVLDGKALLSRFRHPERKREEPVFAAAFHTLREQTQIYSVEELRADMILEGAGDCIRDQQRGQFWMAYGPRSDRAASHVVTDHFGAECVALELADPSFYHLDTAFCALPSGDVIYYPGAFTASARHAIEERVGPSQRIALDHAEAAQFSANAVSFDHCLVLSACTDALRRRVEERGFTVLTRPRSMHSCAAAARPAVSRCGSTTVRN